MTTPKGMALKNQLITQLKDRGYSWQFTDWPRRITWFKASGEAMPNLPADPWHMERYLARGFRPDLPKITQVESVSAPETAQAEIAEQVQDHSCPKCGREMRADRCAWCKDEEE